MEKRRPEKIPGKSVSAVMRSVLISYLILFGLCLPFSSPVVGELTAIRERDRKALFRIESPARGLPAVPLPADNPPSAAKILLGRKLFFDSRLSHNGTVSCASCHVPEEGFTINEKATALGMEGKSLRRNAPTLLNVAFAKTLFLDGRETTLETQVISPFLARDEMANPSIGFLIEKIRGLDDYEELFHRAFGRGVGIEAVGAAIASYERSLVSGNSPFDRWHYGNEEDALTPKEKEGFYLFVDKARCLRCHVINEDFALFTDSGFHDTGVGWKRSVGNPDENDLGRYEVTGNPSDRWRFKTPTLRNIALTAPYMHDGSLSTLRDVVAFYDKGGFPHENLDPIMQPLHLTDAEIDALVAFLNSLTGDNIQELVDDARSVKSGNPE